MKFEHHPPVTEVQVGDSIQIDARDNTLDCVVEMVLTNGVVVAKDSDGDRFYATRSNFGQGRWDEVYEDEAFEDDAYAEKRRKELQPDVGDRVELKIVTHAGQGEDEGGDFCELAVEGTVLEINEDGDATIKIDSFELIAGADYWLNVAKYSSADDVLGLFSADGEPIN